MDSRSSSGVKTFIVTSSKGGVGKSTVAANLAAAVAKSGRRVLLIDCDISNRSLDMILGCEDGSLCDLFDLVACRADVSKAVIEIERVPGLYFIPAPSFNSDSFTSGQISDALQAAAGEYSCDLILIDVPGAVDGILPLVAGAADGALVVTTHQPLAVRAAEKTGYQLEELGVSEQYLIINNFDTEGVLDGSVSGINEIIDRAHVRLIGVVPESEELEEAQSKGVLAPEMRRDREHAGDAFAEVAGRLCGEAAPLMSYLPEKKRRKILTI